jgi:O-antigen/teichoic acid export membrane protein
MPGGKDHEVDRATVAGPAPSLGRQMAKGATWMVFMRFAIRGIGLVSMVILARLLVPEDFGLVALATMFYGLLEVMGQFSFDVVLIQNQTADRRHYDTAWTLSVLRNLVLAGLLVAAAPWAAGFFEEPRLQAILYWLALAAVVEGFANIAVVNFRKELRFHKDFALMVGAKLGMFVVAVPLAFIWRDYWALVAGIVAGAFARVVLGYLMHPYRPRFSLAKWREIMGFSKWLVMSNIGHFAFFRVDTFIIGKMAGAEALGFYSIAHEIASLPTTELVSPIRRAIYPGYAKLGSRPDLLRKSFVETLAIIVMIGVPIAVGIGLVADPLVRTVLGGKWIASIPLVQILAIYGLFAVCSANIWPVYIALKKPELFTLVMGIGLVAIVPLLLWGTNTAGVYGAAWAVTAASVIMFVVNTGVVIRLLDLSLMRLASATWRTVLAALAMAVFVLGLQTVWPLAETTADSAVLLVCCIFMGVIVYIGSHLALWRMSGSSDGAEREILKLLQSMFLRSGLVR